MKTQTLDLIHQAVLHTLEKETQRIVEEEAVNAAERVQKRVRAQVGQIATQVASYVSYHQMQDELHITVRLPDIWLQGQMGDRNGGNAWVVDSARVGGNATVAGSAWVAGRSLLIANTEDQLKNTAGNLRTHTEKQELDDLTGKLEEAHHLLRRIARKGEFMDMEGQRLVVSDWLARRHIFGQKKETK